jgi:hypothetical protein
MKHLNNNHLLIVCLITIYAGCSPTEPDSFLDTVDLQSLIVAESFSLSEEVKLQYVWWGGTCLRYISMVMVNSSNNGFVLTPLGYNIRGGSCPTDAFHETETLSLGLLPAGSYEVTLVGRKLNYHSQFIVERAEYAADYEWKVQLLGIDSGYPISGTTLVLNIEDQENLELQSVTDSSGSAIFRLVDYDSASDSLLYRLGADPWHPQIFCSSYAKLGIAETITIGVLGR